MMPPVLAVFSVQAIVTVPPVDGDVDPAAFPASFPAAARRLLTNLLVAGDVVALIESPAATNPRTSPPLVVPVTVREPLAVAVNTVPMPLSPVTAMDPPAASLAPAL